MFKRKSNIAKTISIIILALSILFTLPANSVSAAGGLSITLPIPASQQNQVKMCKRTLHSPIIPAAA